MNCIPQSIQAQEIKVASDIDFMDVSYKIVGNEVQEKVSFLDVDGLVATITNVICENVEATITITKNNMIISEDTYYANYDMYYKIANGKIDEIMPYGNEVTGSQYWHRYVGATSYTYTNDGMKVLITGTTAEIAASLVRKISIPLSIGISFATFVYNVCHSNTNYKKLEVNSTLYEVLRSYDDTYYTHCYHCVYRGYDSGGHLIKSGIDYYQAIGS